MSLREIYTQVILEHYKKPRNKGTISEPTHVSRCDNPLCGDRITLYLVLQGDSIREAMFEGNGCAISQASASIMTQMIKGKSIQEALALESEFRKMLLEPDYRADPKLLGDLIALEGVKKLHARVKCAVCAWHALNGALEGESAVSTESLADLESSTKEGIELEDWEK